MRAIILAAGATLAMSACNGNEATQNTTNVGDNVAAEDIVANDTTAIDAATNDAASMAQESSVMLEPVENETGANAASSATTKAAPDED